MFANVADINGSLEKRLLENQRYAQNAKALIGIRRGKVRNKLTNNSSNLDLIFF